MKESSIQEPEHWDLIIEPQSGTPDLKLKEMWQYRYLISMFVKRDLMSVYKQTILGPIWFFIQPVLTTIMFVVIFANIAKISTDGLPQVLFYLAGITIWNYFSETLTATSNTFVANSNIFGKVYFPRIVLPVSKVFSGLVKFGIQFLLFLGALAFYLIKGADVHPNLPAILIALPVIIVILAGLGLGLGLILSALTIKYRDLTFLIAFGVQLGMYATPVIIPLSAISKKYRQIIEANPLSFVIEGFRNAFLGTGLLSIAGLVYSFICMLVILLTGLIVFNRMERTFMDNV